MLVARWSEPGYRTPDRVPGQFRHRPWDLPIRLWVRRVCAGTEQSYSARVDEPPAARTVFRVEHLVEIGSTNRELVHRAREGAESGLVLVADHQTAGRGRSERRWLDSPGASLLMSVLVRPRAPADRLHLYGTALALAARSAAESFCADLSSAEAGIALKWPNDLVVDHADRTWRKLAGVLVETGFEDNRPSWLVLGLGLNLDTPELPRSDPGLDPVGLREVASGPVSRDDLTEAVLAELDTRLELIRAGAGGWILREARRESAVLGRAVTVEETDGTLVGTAVDIDDSGRLVVRSGGVNTPLVTGEVSRLRPALED